MTLRKAAGDKAGIPISCVSPYDFSLSMRVTGSFHPGPAPDNNSLRLAVRIDGTPAVIEVKPDKSGPDKLKVFSRPASNDSRARAVAEWVLFAELDLAPFYRLMEKAPGLAPFIKKLYGLKPTRPASIFEMAVTAIIEQQISLASAYHIRSRLVQKFGEPVEDLHVFPEPDSLARAASEDLRSCGLSRQKAGYIHGLASGIAAGSLDLDSLKSMDDETARETIMSWRGFGRWSAEYILVRGLARPDCVPADDIGIRNVIGVYLGDGQRATADEVVEKLQPFRPFRGLLAFYLLAYHRLEPATSVI
jgi:DNA-3-methyladenine glycosylase II